MDMRNPNKYYLYHHDHGYDTEEYIQLQDERLEEVITITWVDAQGVQYPHNDVMVVTLNITRRLWCTLRTHW